MDATGRLVHILSTAVLGMGQLLFSDWIAAWTDCPSALVTCDNVTQEEGICMFTLLTLVGRSTVDTGAVVFEEAVNERVGTVETATDDAVAAVTFVCVLVTETPAVEAVLFMGDFVNKETPSAR